jgi:hypothetical protein
MKQTAVEKMIQYFIEQKNNGASHWCIDDLIGQLHQAKAMEKEQIIEANENKMPFITGEEYYNETFKSE